MLADKAGIAQRTHHIVDQLGKYTCDVLRLLEAAIPVDLSMDDELQRRVRKQVVHSGRPFPCPQPEEQAMNGSPSVVIIHIFGENGTKIGNEGRKLSRKIELIFRTKEEEEKLNEKAGIGAQCPLNEVVAERLVIVVPE